MTRLTSTTIARVFGVGVGLVVVGGLLFPAAARPLVSVLLGLVLLAVTAAAVDTLRGRSARPQASAFDRRRDRRRDDLPSDLHGLTVDARRIRARRPMPSVVFWRIRRIAANRLSSRHGLDVTDRADHPRIASVVSADMFAVLTDDRALVVGETVPRLVTELEQL